MKVSKPQFKKMCVHVYIHILIHTHTQGNPLSPLHFAQDQYLKTILGKVRLGRGYNQGCYQCILGTVIFRSKMKEGLHNGLGPLDNLVSSYTEATHSRTPVTSNREERGPFQMSILLWLVFFPILVITDRKMEINQEYARF